MNNRRARQVIRAHCPRCDAQAGEGCHLVPGDEGYEPNTTRDFHEERVRERFAEETRPKYERRLVQ